MIEKICPKCRVPMAGDKCIKPGCGCITEVSSTIYWCEKCNVPIFERDCPLCGTACKYIATDLRPVFPEENMLLSIIISGNPYEYMDKSVWYGSNSYFVQGNRIKFSVSKINNLPDSEIEKIRNLYNENKNKIEYTFFDELIDKFIRANADRYNYINEEAISYLQGYKDKYSVEDMMVSFSGGKDSTVTSHIVNKAFGTNKILHIFGDTTLEFPFTLEYKKRFTINDESKGIRILTAKNREKDFEELCKIVGPPSRVMRWCCTVFKTGAIQKTISSAFKDKRYL